MAEREEFLTAQLVNSGIRIYQGIRGGSSSGGQSGGSSGSAASPGAQSGGGDENDRNRATAYIQRQDKSIKTIDGQVGKIYSNNFIRTRFERGNSVGDGHIGIEYRCGNSSENKSFGKYNVTKYIRIVKVEIRNFTVQTARRGGRGEEAQELRINHSVSNKTIELNARRAAGTNQDFSNSQIPLFIILKGKNFGISYVRGTYPSGLWTIYYQFEYEIDFVTR